MMRSENSHHDVDDFQQPRAVDAERDDVPCVSSSFREQHDFGGAPVTTETPVVGDRNASEGWINAHRAMRKNPTVGFLNEDGSRRRNAKKTCEGMAWLDLCMEAGWKPQTYNNKGRMITLLRGQFVGARAWLAARWGWTEDEVKWFLKKLVRDEMITLGSGDRAEESHQDHTGTAPNQTDKSAQSNTKKRAHFANVITVCNYNIYQTAKELETLLSRHPTPNQAPNRNDTSAHPAPIQRPHIEEGNKEKKEEREREDIGEQREVAPPPPPVEALAPVRMNCTAIIAPGFSIPYSSIAAAATSTGLDPDRAKELAFSIAEEWHENGRTPRSPSGMLLTAFKKHVEAGKPKEDEPVLFDLGPPDVRPKRVTKAGVRLDADFVLPESWRAWAKQEHALQDGQIDAEVKKFVRWWTGADAKNAAKKDWKRTWENWVDRSVSSGRIAKAVATPQQQQVFNPLPYQESNCSDVVWQKRLKQFLEKGACTLEQAVARGFRP